MSDRLAAPTSAVHVLRVCTGELEENCFLVWRAAPWTGAGDTPETPALVIDPGADASAIQAALAERRLRPAAFLLTHCHGDHIGALAELKAAHPRAEIVVHEAEAAWLGNPLRNLSYFLGANVTAPAAERSVKGGEDLEYAGLRVRVLHVPGHSPGGVAYWLAGGDGAPPHLLCGDILFQAGIGRTDLPGGAGEETLIENIQRVLFPLPEDTVVHPGHGPDTSIGAEKQENPYCGQR